MKLFLSQLRLAADHAAEICRLEALREHVEDTQVVVRVGGATPDAPLGSMTVASAMAALGVRDQETTVVVTVPASSIRAQLCEQLEPHYRELRNLGIELQR